MPFLYRASLNKWWFDELNDLLFIRLGGRVAALEIMVATTASQLRTAVPACMSAGPCVTAGVPSSGINVAKPGDALALCCAAGPFNRFVHEQSPLAVSGYSKNDRAHALLRAELQRPL